MENKCQAQNNASGNILDVKSVSVRFGGLVAVNNVTLHHCGGEILSLIGPNGAGKTTIFNLLTGIYQPDGGRIHFMGRDITSMHPHERVRVGIARTFQNIRLFTGLTVLENLLIAHPGCNRERILPSVILSPAMRSRRRRIIEECEEILQMVGLLDQQKLLSTSLPYGKQRLLEIGRAMATDPSLILLDEPGAGMNAMEKEELTALIRHITQVCKKHVLFIEHDMRFVMGISDRIIVLDHGEKIAEGTASEIQNNQQVIEAYLGRAHSSDPDAEYDWTADRGPAASERV
ncbi:MAG: ABC transporter ATP-binding protein [Christensenellales bacterium]